MGARLYIVLVHSLIDKLCSKFERIKLELIWRVGVNPRSGLYSCSARNIAVVEQNSLEGAR